MHLTILGSGTLVPREIRASPGYFLRTDHYNILIDCGPGTLRQLVKAGGDYRDIDVLLFSHQHPDHVTDFPAFLQALNYTPGFERKKPLTILARRGFSEFYNDVIALLPSIAPVSYEITINESFAVRLTNLDIKTCDGNHSDSSIMMKFIDNQGCSFVYTGDTGPGAMVEEFAHGAGVLVTECSHPEDKLKGIHLTPRTAGMLAKNAKVERLVLSHMYPTIDAVDLAGEMRKYYTGELIIARDLQTIQI